VDAPDIVLLDLMLPKLDGIEVCRSLKNDPLTRSIPIIMVTAKGEESDIVLGLGVGADDYVTKPFSPRELLARVKAVLRRGPYKDERGSGERIVRGGVTVDSSRHEVLVDGAPIEFTATEFRLLHTLASHPGRVFTRDHLISRVIGEDAVVMDRNIDVHIRSVRKKLAEHRELVETIRGVGYRFRYDDN
jgi:DNA-binding response OmpR family regulator